MSTQRAYPGEAYPLLYPDAGPDFSFGADAIGVLDDVTVTRTGSKSATIDDQPAAISDQITATRSAAAAVSDTVAVADLVSVSRIGSSAPTPPTRVGSVLPPEGWASVSSPKTSLAFDVQDGDLVTIMAITQHSSYRLGTPTWTGSGTIVSRQVIELSNYCQAYLYTIDVTAAATGRTVTVTRTVGTTGFYSFMVTVWRDHGGLGVTGKANLSSGAPSLTLTTQANSAVGCAVGDWNAINAARTWRTINGAPMIESSYDYVSSTTYAVYTGYTPDVGAAGTKTLGLTAPTGQKYSIVGFEVLAGQGSGTSSRDVAERDRAGIADAVTAGRGVAKTAGDVVPVSDAVEVERTAGSRTYEPADAFGVTDTVTADLDVVTEASDEGVPITDAVEAVQSGPGAYELEDHVEILDDVATEQVHDVVVELADAVGVLDDVAREGGAFDYDVEIHDEVFVDDEAEVLEKFVDLTDQFAIVDEVDTAWITFAVIADAAGISDDIETGRGSPVTPADSVGLEDQTTVASTRAVHAADTVPLEDSVLAEWEAGGSAEAGDTLGVADAVHTTRTRTATIADTVLAIDAFTSLDADQVLDGRILQRRTAARILVRWQARQLPPRAVARITGRRWGVGGQLARRAFAHIIGRRFDARIKED